MASAGIGKAADPKGNIKLLCICGDAPKAYPKRSEKELEVRLGQADSLKEKLEAAGRSVDLGCVRFAPTGFETPGGFKAGSSDVLLVVLLCHGIEGDGVPAVAAEFIRGSAATVIAKCLCGLESIAGAGKKLLVSAQCYGGLKFRDKMVEQLPTDWLVHASCGNSTHSTCDAGGKWHQLFAENSADDLDDLVAGKWQPGQNKSDAVAAEVSAVAGRGKVTGAGASKLVTIEISRSQEIAPQLDADWPVTLHGLKEDAASMLGRALEGTAGTMADVNYPADGAAARVTFKFVP